MGFLAPINLSQNLLNSYDEAEFAMSQKELLTHVSNKDNYRTDQYRIVQSANITADYEFQNQRRSYFSDCKFINTNFDSSGFVGSYFVNCEFVDCTMNFAILDNCFFMKCKISFMKSTKIMAASFCNSKIYDSELNNCHFQSSSLTGIDCKNARFIDCIFDAIIWENAKFFHCILENVILKDINIEFVCFDNTEFIGTKFPFASIPFSFKCLEYILNTEREIKISSEVSVDGISRQEYLEKLPHLIKFYSYTKNYFPLANILVAINELDEAFVAIKQGVIFSIKLHEYRTLKYFSVLMMLSSFTGEQKSEIYELINSELNRQAMSSVNTYGSSVYLFEIRDNLLNGREKPYVSFEIYADIDCKSSAKLSTIINSIESMMTIFGSESNHYIEFRHNSPFQFLVGFFSNTQNIVALIAAFYLAYKGSYKFYNDYLDTTQKKLEIIKIKEEIKHLEKTNSESLNVEVFDESEALQKLKEVATQISNTIYANNIIINTVNHNVYNVDVGNYGYNFQEYNLK